MKRTPAKVLKRQTRNREQRKGREAPHSITPTPNAFARAPALVPLTVGR